jgi:hypothetical protein
MAFPGFPPMFHIERRVHIEQPQVLVHVPVPVFGSSQRSQVSLHQMTLIHSLVTEVQPINPGTTLNLSLNLNLRAEGIARIVVQAGDLTKVPIVPNVGKVIPAPDLREQREGSRPQI